MASTFCKTKNFFPLTIDNLARFSLIFSSFILHRYPQVYEVVQVSEDAVEALARRVDLIA